MYTNIKYAVGEELECFIDTHNKYSTNAIKVESNAGKKEKQLVGPTDERLANTVDESSNRRGTSSRT